MTRHDLRTKCFVRLKANSRRNKIIGLAATFNRQIPRGLGCFGEIRLAYKIYHVLRFSLVKFPSKKANSSNCS